MQNRSEAITRKQFLKAAALLMTRGRVLKAAALLGGTAGGVGLYTWRWEPHWLEVVERPLPVAHLPESLHGARLVQLSDLHIGERVDDQYLIRTFETVRNLAPDLVVYTGDFTDYHADVFAHAERMFSRLPLGKRGTFGVLGNHDYGELWNHPEVAARLETLATAAGVKMLRNQVADVEGLQIAGLDDLWGKQFDLQKTLAAVDPGRAAIYLSHNPDTADDPGWGGRSGWILAGHTHGGQCKPPFLPPPLLPVRNRRYTSGEFALQSGRRMYISRGVGHLLRVRFNVRPEVTLFQLERA